MVAWRKRFNERVRQVNENAQNCGHALKWTHPAPQYAICDMWIRECWVDTCVWTLRIEQEESFFEDTNAIIT